jgi:hypothetical protein
MDSQIQVLEGLGYGPVSIEGLAATESPRADPGLAMFDGKLKWAVLAVALLGVGFVGWRWWKGRSRGAAGLTGLGRAPKRRKARKGGGKKRRSKRSLGAVEPAQAATLAGAPKRKGKGKGGNRGAFARAAKSCKGQGGDAFRACMKRKLAA